ncbi:hypothetical protein ABPG77_003807 [Micractinium sp. CCAP 211/92]
MKHAVTRISQGPGRSHTLSFAALEARRLPAPRLLLALTSLLGWLSVPLSCAHAVWPVTVQFGIPPVLLALVVAYPAAYRRRGHLLSAALHVLHACGLQVGRDPALAQGGDASQSALLWLAMLCSASGVTSSVTCLLAFQLPPVAMAASSLARAAVAASGNGRLCDSALLAHPAAAWRMGTLYRLLEPLIAPLEPLLLAAGIGLHHRARRCHCVLAALQFWAVGVLPAALAAQAAACRYKAWRAQQRRAERQRRREQAEAWGFGFREPSSSSSSCLASDCGASGSGSEDGQRCIRPACLGAPPRQELSALQIPPPLLSNLLAKAARRPAPAARHHPEDWQYWAVQRLLRAPRGALAAAALAVAVGTTWHRQAFP